MMHEEDTIEVVQFVAYGLRQQTLSLEVSPVAVRILSPDSQRRRSNEIRK